MPKLQSPTNNSGFSISNFPISWRNSVTSSGAIWNECTLTSNISDHFLEELLNISYKFWSNFSNGPTVLTFSNFPPSGHQIISYMVEDKKSTIRVCYGSHLKAIRQGTAYVTGTATERMSRSPFHMALPHLITSEQL